MRVLLCYPFKDNAYYKVGFVLPPLGLGYIASNIRKHGHDVEIIDLNLRQERIRWDEYDVVGISADTPRYNSAKVLAAKAKAAGCKVMMGGPHVTFMDEEVLKEGLADVVIRGEGEETTVDVLNAFSKGHNIDEISGISFIQDSTVVRTPDRHPPDIEQLPAPARDLLRIKEYRFLEMGGRKITGILTSRGCPYNCSFCSSSEFSGLKWRALRPERVVDEIEDIVTNYGFSGIAFLDDNFTLNPARVKEICTEIIRRKLDIYWWCFSRADTLLRNEDMVRIMAKAGARYIFVGFESAGEAVLEHYHKRIDPNMSKEVVKLLRSHGISTHASFIIGDIEETVEMVEQTIEFAKRLSPEAVQFSILTPYPGTKLYEEVKDRIFTRNWDLYDCLHPVMRLDHLSPEQTLKLLRKAYIRFYLTPRRIINGILSPLRGRGIKVSSILKILRGVA